MVSLRQRTARVSYSNVAEGLEDLGESPEARKTRLPEETVGVGDIDMDAGDAASMSSGESSAFDPDDKDNKGDDVYGESESSDGNASEDGGAEDAFNDGLASSKGARPRSRVATKPKPTTPIARRPKPPVSSVTPVGGKGGRFRRGDIFAGAVGETAGHRRSTTAAVAQSSLKALPPSYVDLLRLSVNSLARDGPPLEEAKNDSTLPLNGRNTPRQTPAVPSRFVTATSLITFPPGPFTPFSTRLRSPPSPRDSSDVVAFPMNDDEHQVDRMDRRREENREKAKHVALLSPWTVWEGEGWWPEMYKPQERPVASSTAVGPKAKGKSRVTSAKAKKSKDPEPQLSSVDDDQRPGPVQGWKWREDVRLGLDNVGRHRKGNGVLEHPDGESYLPRGPTISVLHGTPKDWRKSVLPQFTCTSTHRRPGISGGLLFSAGGPVWGLDWCPYPERLAAHHGYVQYLAVATHRPNVPDPAIGAKGPHDAKGAIQIWSVLSPDENATEKPEGEALCELVLCIDGGSALEVKWMPLGAWDEVGSTEGLPKLGILVVAQLDGSASLYSVPHPRSLTPSPSGKPTYLHAAPLIKLDIADAAIHCVDWLGGTRLAAGLSNGHLAIWDLGDALRSHAAECPLPSVYTMLTMSGIRSIAAGRVPPSEHDGNPEYDGDTPYVVFGSYDGTSGMVDLRDPSVTIDYNRARLPCMAVAWGSSVAGPLIADVDYTITLGQMRSALGPAARYLAPHRGPVWDLSTSDYHPMVVSTAADGSVILSNIGMGFFKRKTARMLFQRLYECDYDEHNGEYRMTECFLPETMGLEEATSKGLNKKSGKKEDKNKPDAAAPTEGNPAVAKVASWSRNVGVHRAAWQNGAGIGRAGWLATAGFSGIVRVEEINGRCVGL